MAFWRLSKYFVYADCGRNATITASSADVNCGGTALRRVYKRTSLREFHLQHWKGAHIGKGRNHKKYSEFEIRLVQRIKALGYPEHVTMLIDDLLSEDPVVKERAERYLNEKEYFNTPNYHRS